MYKYEDYREFVLTEEGQRTFLKIRDHVANLLEQAGAVQMRKAISVIMGDSWERVACVDRLVELGELKEITRPGVVGQFRTFVKPGKGNLMKVKTAYCWKCDAQRDFEATGTGIGLKCMTCGNIVVPSTQEEYHSPDWPRKAFGQIREKPKGEQG